MVLFLFENKNVNSNMQIFYKKNVLLCVTGGIAAYKSAEITRLFKKEGADVRIIMTESSKEFITPLTLQAVSGNQIHDSLLDEKAEAGMGHIELAKWADILLVAPCTAETLSKINQGRADDLLGAVILATNAKIFIAPAMNVNMWLDPTTQANHEQLKSKKVFFIGPDSGDRKVKTHHHGSGKTKFHEKYFSEKNFNFAKTISIISNFQNL